MTTTPVIGCAKVVRFGMLVAISLMCAARLAIAELPKLKVSQNRRFLATETGAPFLSWRHGLGVISSP